MLLNLVLEFDRRLLAAKQERHLIDFSDMEHYALQILLKREKVEETGDAGTDSTGDTGMDSTKRQRIGEDPKQRCSTIFVDHMIS